MKIILKSNLVGCLISWLLASGITIESHAQIDELKIWLNKETRDREEIVLMDFSQMPLTKEQVAEATELLFLDKQEQILKRYETDWDNRVLKVGLSQTPFFYQVFGEEPLDGRSLFISLHGGGGTTNTVNNQQYENQKTLYDATMNTIEGVYLAPRAPTDTWDLWHQGHIDDLLNTIIQLAVIKENVNPNKVYLLGYSAGGDGVYQLAPRMADRWAAAAMMAGHPNDASPVNLRNMPFAIHMGALDDAFDRNTFAERWGEDLDELQGEDARGYAHDVQIYEGLGHWMELRDAVALPWMAGFERNPIPEKIVWRQDDRHHTSFYCCSVPEEDIRSYGQIHMTYTSTTNEVDVLRNYSDNITIMFNDDMMDLDDSITVKYQGNEVFKGLLTRDILTIHNSLKDKGDLSHAFSASITFNDIEDLVEEPPVTVLSVSGDLTDPITIYPNPTSDYLNISWPMPLGQEYIISIVSAEGKIIQEFKTQLKDNQLQIGNLNNAVYFLQISDGVHTSIYRVVKED